MTMDNYIVRVLRREHAKSDNVARMDGVVETVELGTRHAFHNADELWAILGGETGSKDHNNQNATTQKKKR